MSMQTVIFWKTCHCSGTWEQWVLALLKGTTLTKPEYQTRNTVVDEVDALLPRMWIQPKILLKLWLMESNVISQTFGGTTSSSWIYNINLWEYMFSNILITVLWISGTFQGSLCVMFTFWFTCIFTYVFIFLCAKIILESDNSK